jgi:hypothetical protein
VCLLGLAMIYGMALPIEAHASHGMWEGSAVSRPGASRRLLQAAGSGTCPLNFLQQDLADAAGACQSSESLCSLSLSLFVKFEASAAYFFGSAM